MKITSSSTIGKQVEFLADHQFHALVQRGRETFNKKLVLYEFGVFTGNNALAMLIGYGCRRYFGFDSFVGLPEELDGIEIRDQWHKGNFNASETLGVPIENAIEHIRTKLANRNPKTDVVLIHEWYENLSKEHIANYRIEPAHCIYIDCDLYISAKQALEFVFDNNLLLEGGFIMYDDWTCNPKMGEDKAHFEAIDKYNLRLDWIDNTPVPHFQYNGHKSEKSL